MKRLTYIVPLYFTKDSNALSDLLDLYSTYSSSITSNVDFIFIDDCSPLPVLIPSDCNLNIRLYRINEDIRWNQPGARNLGAVFAKTDYILMTDLDHRVSEKTFEYLLKKNFWKNRVYLFRRKDHNGIKVRSHPNTFVISRSTFFGCYGYDEEFCGNYGYDDEFFLKWLLLNGVSVKKISFRNSLTLVSKDVDTHHLVRDSSFNKGLLEKKLARGKLGHSKLFLNFGFVRC